MKNKKNFKSTENLISQDINSYGLIQRNNQKSIETDNLNYSFSIYDYEDDLKEEINFE